MDASNLDIIYLLKDSAYNDELKYSLRSVEQNFPHRKVFFYGGKPTGLVPDEQVILRQRETTKYDRVRTMLQKVCEDDRITKDFVLFNDDFFVMKPVKLLSPYYYETLEWLCDQIDSKRKTPSPYTERLKDTAMMLKRFIALEQSPLNFELHIPMIFNREQLSTVLRWTNLNGVRSIYGNIFYTPPDNLPSSHPDVKIIGTNLVPANMDFLSTTENSFGNGAVGRLIRETFPNKSRFER